MEEKGIEDTEDKSDKSGLPLKQEVFLEAGVHIGTKIRTNDMRDFVFKRRDDGLFILDLRKSAERLMTAAKILSQYKPEDITVVASRVYSSNPASKFASLTGINIVKGRFVPGTMTNMTCKGFIEPRVLLVCDPKGEREAIAEAAKNGVPILALCDTDNETRFVDFVIPINNKGKRSLALAFYLLTREILMSQGKISSYDEFKHDISYFEQFIVEEEKPEATEETAQEPSPEPGSEPEQEAEASEKEPSEAKEGKPKEESGEKPSEAKEEKASKQKEEKPADAEEGKASEAKEGKPKEESGEKPSEAKEGKSA